MTQSKKSQPSPFRESIRWALANFTEPSLLGSQSPLASPYLLRDHLIRESVPTDAERGRALQSLLRRATDELTGTNSELYQTLIELHYFEGKDFRDISDGLPFGKTTFFKYRKQLLPEVEKVLLSILNPAVRLDSPVEPRQRIWGREPDLDSCLERLGQVKSVNIAGSGGSGKSTLGSMLTRRWEEKNVFWYTIRPGLNDRVDGLLFNLGYFLHTLGASILWQEMVVGSGKIDPTHALNIFRDAIKTLNEVDVFPIFCFDEVDQLHPSERGEHSQILTFIEELRGLVPLLLIGQQALIEAHHFCHLEGLSLADAKEMLAEEQCRLNHKDLQMVYDFTQGNPRLLELFAAVHYKDETVSSLLEELGDSSPVEFLLCRMLRRLEQVERCLLAELCVYQTLIPIDICQNSPRAAVLQRLLERRLVNRHGEAKIGILPAYRTIIYRNVPSDKRSQLHARAGEIFVQRAAYTTAAYHYVAAEQPAKAIILWKENQQYEVNSGHAHQALNLFKNVQHYSLSANLIDMLTVLCAELERLIGQNDQAIADLHTMFRDVEILGIEANSLEAIIHNDKGNLEESEKLLEQVLAQTEKLVQKQLALAHKGLGWRYIRDLNFDKAWSEALLARYEAINFQGSLETYRSNHIEAEAYLQDALKLAKEIDYVEGIAKTSNNLSALYARLGRFENAEEMQRLSDECAKTIGKTLDIVGSKINWAFLHNLSANYTGALTKLQEALLETERFQLDVGEWLDALVAQAMAESYLGLGDLDQAEAHVLNAIEMEDSNTLPDSLRTLGEILLERDQLKSAEGHISQSITLSEENGDRYLMAYGHRAQARVYLSQGKSEDAFQEQQLAIDLFEEINLPNEVVKTLAALNIASDEQNGMH